MTTARMRADRIVRAAESAAKHYEAKAREMEAASEAARRPKRERGTLAYFMFGSGVEAWDGTREAIAAYGYREWERRAKCIATLARNSDDGFVSIGASDAHLIMIAQQATARAERGVSTMKPRAEIELRGQ